MNAWLWIPPLAAAGVGLWAAALATSTGLGRRPRRDFDSGAAGMVFRLPCGHAREIGPRTDWLRALREGCARCRREAGR